MRARQKKKNFTKVLFCTKIKKTCKCKQCGSKDLDLYYTLIKPEEEFIICFDCFKKHKIRWINHRKVKI